MNRKHNHTLTPAARELRKNMTREERHLWYDYLRQYPVKFYRQRVIDRFIADFYCPQAKLVVELDGSQHYDEVGLARDEERTAVLNGYGIRVIRIPNNEVMDNFRGVCEHIDAAVKLALRETPQSKIGDF